MKFSRQLERSTLRFAPFLVGLVLLAAAPVASGASEPRPAPPANLSALAVSVQETVLTWSAASADAGITRYSIHRNGAWLATVGSQTPAFVDVGVQASATYTYTVRAIGVSDDSSAPSNIAVVQVPALPELIDTSPPGMPASLTATAIAGGVLLDWYDASDDSDITAYLIRRNGRALAIVGSAVRSYADMNIQPPALASYTIEAIDVMGQHSQQSNIATLTL